MPDQLEIEVRDTVFDPNVKRSMAKVYVRREEGRPIYKVYIYLEGFDLPYIESVTYTLHETFLHPTRTVRRTPSNPTCNLVIWTWGLFVVKALIVDIKGATYAIEHALTYDKELPSDSDRYFYEDATSLASA